MGRCEGPSHPRLFFTDLLINELRGLPIAEKYLARFGSLIREFIVVLKGIEYGFELFLSLYGGLLLL